jgi:hypothetical protein
VCEHAVSRIVYEVASTTTSTHHTTSKMAWSEGRGGDGASLGQRQSDLMAAVARIDALLDQVCQLV